MEKLRDALLDEISSIRIDDLGYTDDGYTNREVEIFRRLKDSYIEVVLTLVCENKTTMDRICSDPTRKERIDKEASQLLKEENNNKNLTAGEALDIVLSGGAITDKDNICKFELSNFMEVSGGDLRLLLNNEWYKYTPPEKPKKLSEKFFHDYSDSDFETVTKIEVYNWLKKQEDDEENN